MRKTLSVVALIAATALTMAACSSTEPEAKDSSPATDQTTVEATDPATEASAEEAPAPELITIKVGASPVPHGDILRFIQDNLAAEAGLDIQIEEFSDYILPNKSLDSGDLDANYFQTQQYLAAQVEEFGYDFFAFPGVHVEPLAVYSDGLTSLDDIPDGGNIGLSNDPANQARGLRLLADAGVFTLADTGDANPTILDLEDNPKNVKLEEVDPQTLGPNLSDYSVAVINGNYAIEAGLSPATDALLVESGVDNPYANFLVSRTADKDRPELVKLDALLHTPEVAAFIAETWSDGSVIAAF